ncbi:MAG TPA: ester cyclase [Chloroflexia bacterium]|jgi:steroid delta-isomerase-like uncharacterized protein|nr:ester cyclase [Chloroflexia bacterium]
MSTDENKTIVRRYFTEVLNEGNLAALDTLAEDDYIENNPLPGQGTGREGFKQRVGGLRAAFPDIRYTIEDMVAKGDRVALRWSMRATHGGEILGIPATGQQVTMAGLDIYRLADGRLAEHWDQVDVMGLLQQLGVIPAPSEAG